MALIEDKDVIELGFIVDILKRHEYNLSANYVNDLKNRIEQLLNNIK